MEYTMLFAYQRFALEDVNNGTSPIGPNYNPKGRLLGRFNIGSTSFHVELVQVHEVDDVQEAVLPSEEHCYNELANAAGNYGPFETVTVDGRDYVMFIYPFCK